MPGYCCYVHPYHLAELTQDGTLSSTVTIVTIAMTTSEPVFSLTFRVKTEDDGRRAYEGSNLLTERRSPKPGVRVQGLLPLPGPHRSRPRPRRARPRRTAPELTCGGGAARRAGLCVVSFRAGGSRASRGGSTSSAPSLLPSACGFRVPAGSRCSRTHRKGECPRGRASRAGHCLARARAPLPHRGRADNSAARTGGRPGPRGARSGVGRVLPAAQPQTGLLAGAAAEPAR